MISSDNKPTGGKDGLVASFRVYPDRKSRLCCMVRIYRSAGQMRRAINQRCGKRIVRGSEFDGMCVYTKEAPCFAITYFTCSKLWDVVVAHEMLHAAFEWARVLKMSRKRIFDQNNQENERFVEGCARMVAQFWRGYSKKHMYGDSWF